MSPQFPATISADQKNMIFENMSDGVITLDSDGTITYCNSASLEILRISSKKDILGQSFKELFMNNKKNRAFNKLFRESIDKGKVMPKTSQTELFDPDADYNPDTGFNGMVILIEDDTDKYKLRQHEHDCAFIFAGLILCISVFLMTWSLLQFTLHIYLKSSVYTQIIECITFLLFLVIVFMTSFSMRDIGLIPRKTQ